MLLGLKRTRVQCQILAILVLVLFLILLACQPKSPNKSKEPISTGKFNNDRKNEKTTYESISNNAELSQDKINEKHLASLQSSHHMPIKRMNHDPLGVILHMPKENRGLKHVISPNHHVVSNKLLDSNKMTSFHRVVHLDLKGAPPKIDYLKKIVPLLGSLGVTGLLMEYEDMFPYWGDLQLLAASNAYDKKDLMDFVKIAAGEGLEIIPLIQTFGHMESILKLEAFSFLREVPNYPQVICPTNNRTFPLIKNVINQIMEVHPGINWLHIGSDEVYNIGECLSCQNYIMKEEISKEELFLRHSVRIVKYVKDSFDIQPIMWDDEFRKIPLKFLMNSGIGKYVEVMVWKYNPGILANIGNDIWEKYGEVFNGVWIASAFKGADRPDTYLTDMNDRLNNNKEWMDVFDLFKGNIPFKGIALTGWQRFDHFAVLCELFPQAIPSLAISMAYILKRKSDHTALSAVGDALGCDSFLNLDLKYIEFVNHCNFPGSKVYEISQRLFMLQKDMNSMLDSNHVRGWINKYNVKHKFASPQMVEAGLQDLPMLVFEFKKLLSDAENALKEVYDEHTVNEWIELNLEEKVSILNKLFQNRKELLSKTFWPRKPLQESSDKEL